MARSTTTPAAKRGRSKAAAAPAPEAPELLAGLRREAATTRLAEADAALRALKAAVKADNADAVRKAADLLAGAATGTRRLWNTRKRGAAPRPSAAPGKGEWVAVVDGAIVRDSGYKASLQRDVALARKRIKDGEARPDRGANRPADSVLARAKVMLRTERKAEVAAS